MRVAETEAGKEIALYVESDKRLCPMCGALAVVPLTPRQLAKQPDDTTHVCHPVFGGCNHGFAENKRDPR
jgi:hypothetical protein